MTNNTEYSRTAIDAGSPTVSEEEFDITEVRSLIQHKVYNS